MNKDQQIEELEARVGELVEGNNKLRAELDDVRRNRRLENAAVDGADAPEEHKKRGRPAK